MVDYDSIYIQSYFNHMIDTFKVRNSRRLDSISFSIKKNQKQILGIITMTKMALITELTKKMMMTKKGTRMYKLWFK